MKPCQILSTVLIFCLSTPVFAQMSGGLGRSSSQKNTARTVSPTTGSAQKKLSSVDPKSGAASASTPLPAVTDTTKTKTGSTAEKENKSPQGQNRSYAILVGVDTYPTTPELTEDQKHLLPTGFSDLRFCAADMKGLKKALIDAKFCKDEDVQLLVAGVKTPTEGKVLEVIQETLKKVQPHDRVLFAFSGHGISIPLEGRNSSQSEDYLCCSDAKVVYNNVTQRFNTKEGILSRSMVEEMLDKSPAGVKLVFIDACRSQPVGMDAPVDGTIKSQGASATRGTATPGGFFGALASTAKLRPVCFVSPAVVKGRSLRSITATSSTVFLLRAYP